MLTEYSLADLSCPDCDSALTDFQAGVKPSKAMSFDRCRRRCHACGIGFSNSRVPTQIYRDPLRNVPVEVRNGALCTLRKALNLTNRPSKYCKFGFSTSEDALTWTVFTHLREQGQLAEIAHRQRWLNSSDGGGQPDLHLWGVPQPCDGSHGEALPKSIEAILLDFREDPRKFSEPDVLLDFGAAGVVLIEVKYMTGNDVQVDTKKFDKYLGRSDGFADRTSILASGLYELTRNWAIGDRLAGNRTLTLVNLVARPIPSEMPRISAFIRGIKTNERRRFQQLLWGDLLSTVARTGWFGDYLHHLPLNL